MLATIALLLSCSPLLVPLPLLQRARLLAPAPGPSFEAIAFEGDPAPGAPGPFAFFGNPVVQGTTTLFSQPPGIAPDGTIGFTGGIPDPGGTFLDGVWRTGPGGLRLAALEGMVAPRGGGDVFLGFPGFPALLNQAPPVGNDVVGFPAHLQTPTGLFSPAFGVWADRSGSLLPIVIRGDELPGMPVGGQVSQIGFNVADDGAVLFNAAFSGGVASEGNNGLWRSNPNGVLEAIAVAGQQPPGFPEGAIFGGNLLGGVHRSTFRPDGLTAFTGYAEGFQVDDEDDEGVWLETPAGLQLVVREGDAAKPAGNRFLFQSSTGFQTFASATLAPRLSSNGHLVFGARLLERGPNETGDSLWAMRGAGLELVAKAASPFIGGTYEGDPAPGFGAGALFETMLEVAIDARGTIALRVDVHEPGDSPFTVREAIYWDEPGSLTLLATAGLDVAGLPGVRFETLGGLLLTDDAGMFLGATLEGEGIGPANDSAFLHVDRRGRFSIVLQEGDAIDVAGSMRVLDGFVVGEGRSARGAFAVEALFADGGVAVLRMDPDGARRGRFRRAGPRTAAGGSAPDLRDPAEGLPPLRRPHRQHDVRLGLVHRMR